MAFLGQETAAGALLSLYAATEPVVSGEFFGPSRTFNMSGSPMRVRLPKRANDLTIARALWKASEILTGVSFDLGLDIQATA
jgi:hypothetical protein